MKKQIWLTAEQIELTEYALECFKRAMQDGITVLGDNSGAVFVARIFTANRVDEILKLLKAKQ